MKNIHLLDTNKPSRLYYKDGKYKLANSTMAMDWYISSVGYKPINIHVTYEGDIREGDVGISINNTTYTHFDYLGKNYGRKIVLTTDLELIRNGVQAIPDDFLEWFVKNSKCKFVKVERYGYMEQEPYEYKIIFPKEEPKMLECYFTPNYNTTSATICSNCGKEKMLHSIGNDVELSKYFINPEVKFKNRQIGAAEFVSNKVMENEISKMKQETKLEEAALINYKELYEGEPLTQDVPIDAFINGAKWQQQISYSEEEVLEILSYWTKANEEWSSVEIWFEKYKKK